MSAGKSQRGVRTLLYSGTYDWQCSWYATKLWLDKLEWTGAAAYRAEAFRDWRVGGEGGGETHLIHFPTGRYCSARFCGHSNPRKNR